ncbi:MAG: DsrE family protein [Bryobacteraceae bacterium]
MKTRIAAVAFGLALLATQAVSQSQQAAPQTSQAAKHKVVFELNAPAPSGWDQLFNNVRNIQKAFEKDGVQIEIVFFGKGLPMLLKSNSEYAERLKQAHDSGVVLGACQNTMRAMKIKSEDLFPFSTEVDSGAAELVRKQEEGFKYIKGGE